MLSDQGLAKPHHGARTIAIGVLILVLGSLATMALMTGSIPFSKPAICLADIERVEQNLNEFAGTTAEAVDETAGVKAARTYLKNARECFASSRWDDARRHLECAEINVIIAKHGGGVSLEQIKQNLPQS